MSTSTPMLQVEKLSTHYGAICAVNEVTLHVNRGEIVSLIGSNGAGKTSLLMTICGTPRASGGKVILEGQDVTQLPTHEIMRKGLAISPEGRRVFPQLTVVENLKMGGFFQDKEASEKGVAHVFELFPRLEDRASQRAGTMSGGEQQMLVIGRALMAKPKLLLLDEPSLGIAPKLVQDIARSIVAINRDEKVSVLLVEQNSRMALRISQRAYALTTGTVALSGNSAELLNDERVKRLYLGAEV